MKNLTTKQLQRIEKKKKKMAALLEITKLNDKDREAKMLALKKAVSIIYDLLTVWLRATRSQCKSSVRF